MKNLRIKHFGLIILATFFLSACQNTGTSDVEKDISEKSKTAFIFEEREFDFGTIKQSGGIVSHEFKFTYNGEDPITITDAVGSCACTKGKVGVTKLEKGDAGTLTVEFDPNLHEEPEGKFFKTVALLTEPKMDESPEVKIWTEIDLDLGPEAFKLQGPHDDGDDHHDDETAHASGQAFHSLQAIELKQMLEDKNFFLLDVHIPEQEHIPGTDVFIDYQKIIENQDKLPTDKDAKLVVYCRSGSMSKAAMKDLIELGYTNLYDLEGGINAFNAL